MNSSPTMRTPNTIRVVAALLLPFLLTAGVLLYGWPDRTAALFAWTINPPFTALLMGAGFLSGLYFFSRVAMGAEWTAVRLGFLPISAFAWLLGGATLLHFDRFHPGHPSFIAWGALYMVTPFLVPLLWWLGHRAVPALPPSQVHMPAVVILILGISGAALLVTGLLLWITPPMMMPWWPWMITPLTSRVVGGFFTLSGLVDIGIAWNRKWRDARIPLQVQWIALVLILLGIARAWPDLHWDNPAAIVFCAVIAFLSVALMVIYALMERKAARFAATSLDPAL